MVGISRRIAFRREALGLTQAELARRAEVGHSSVAFWEMGARIPTAITILRLSQALNISADWLLKGDAA